MGTKILVTGATGFLGRALIEQLSCSGREVVASVRRFSEGFGPEVVQVVNGDMAPDRDWSKTLDGIDRVVHLAARTHVIRETATDPLAEFRRINVRGTLNLASQSARAGVKRFVFVSSVGVHGNRNTRPFTEADPPDPKEPYAVSKLEAEQGLMRLAGESGMEVVIIRSPLVYGPDAPGNFGRLAGIIQKGIPLPLGAVDNKRSLVALDNLLDFIALCLEHPRAANEVFLVADGEDVSTTELIRKIGAAFGKNILLLPVPVWLMAVGLKLAGKNDAARRLFGSLRVDCSKARALLGWKPVTAMDEQLEKMTRSSKK